MADSSSQLKLSIQLDQSKSKQVLSYIQQLRTENRGLADDIKKLDVTSSGLSNTYGKFTAKAVEARNELLKGTKAAEEQTTVLQRLQQAQSSTGSGGGGGSSGGSNLGTIGRGVNVAGQLSQIAGVDTGVQRIGAAASAAAPLLESMGVAESTVAAATPIVGAALIALALAAKTATDAIEAGQKRLDNAIETQKTYYEQLETGTSESIKLNLKDLQVKLAVAEAVRRDIQAGQDQLKGFGILQGLAEKVSGLTDKAKAADDEVSGTQAQIDGLNRALTSSQVAANDAAAAEAKLKQEREDLAGTFSQGPSLAQQIEGIRGKEQQALDQMAQQRAQEAQSEADILQRASDQKIAIVQREAEAEQQALLNLQRANAEAQTQEQQRESDARLAYQRQEVQAARDHERRLLQLRRDEQNSEVDLIRNRDFAALAQSRRTLDQKIDEENDNYAESRRQRLIQLQQTLKDDQTAFIREREARQRAYQQQLSDLRAAEKRDLAANTAAANLEISRLRDKLSAQIKLETDGYNALLAQERRFTDIRLQLLNGLISAAEARAETNNYSGSGGSSGGGTGSTPHEGGTGAGGGAGSGHGGYASGGWLSAGQRMLVNEKGTESFSSGGVTQMLPSGMGYFTPSKGGRVNPAGSSGVNIDLTVNGNNWSDIRRKVHKDLDAKLDEAIGGLVT